IPVWRATRVPVREALADSGAGGRAFGESAFDRALSGVRGVSRPGLLAVRNGFRRRGRLALTLVTFSAAGLFFMSALNIRASMVHALDRLFESRRFDLSIGLAEDAPIDAIERA